jgi:hypothetical protein
LEGAVVVKDGQGVADHACVGVVVVFDILLFDEGSVIVVAVVEKVAHVVGLIIEMLFGDAHEAEGGGLAHADDRPDAVDPGGVVALGLKVLAFEDRGVWHRGQSGMDMIFFFGQFDAYFLFDRFVFFALSLI